MISTFQYLHKSKLYYGFIHKFKFISSQLKKSKHDNNVPGFLTSAVDIEQTFEK